MLIDLHVHTNKYSSCSKMDIQQAVLSAKDKGIDGICITEHDIIADSYDCNKLYNTYGIRVFIGCEINTTDGDIIVFGLNELPKNKISAPELIDIVSENKGVSIAAHPFRDNNRGVGEKLLTLNGLTAVEGYNGNTKPHHNEQAVRIAIERKLPITAASDAHIPSKVGVYYTQFKNKIENVNDLIRELKNGNFVPYIHM